jgi:hypothetical protein
MRRDPVGKAEALFSLLRRRRRRRSVRRRGDFSTRVQRRRQQATGIETTRERLYP